MIMHAISEFAHAHPCWYFVIAVPTLYVADLAIVMFIGWLSGDGP